MAGNPHGVEGPVAGPAAARAADPVAELSTIPPEDPGSAPESVAVGDGALEERGFEARYQRRGEVGKGGMGEVGLYRDERIGREVAVKVMRPELAAMPELRRRFLREARVQGQLEHPAVVPVHDLGVGSDGGVWFTMKRVRGRTLAEILRGLRTGDAETASRWNRRRLISSLSSLCLAVDFAHSRGVVHRDLKPANVMLGDFGEVYLLDWGLARLAGEPSEGATSDASVVAVAAAGDTRLAADREMTQAGTVLGSPGYMAPEQVRGEPASSRSDVYALGALLFEILTGQRMNRGATADEARQAALGEGHRSPIERTPDREIAPELDAICLRATAAKPEERYPSARALHEVIERFLDGDRDSALREQLASQHTREASSAAERALSAKSDDEEAAERERALREVGRAVALDPRSQEASSVLMRLLMTPPRRLPAEALEEIEHHAAEQENRAQRIAVGAWASWVLLVPMVLALGLRRPLELGIVVGLNLVIAAINAVAAHRRQRGGALFQAAVLVNLAGVVALSRVLGPLLLSPILAVTTTVGFLMAGERGRSLLIVGCGVLGVTLPLLLELAGLFPPSFRFADNQLVLLPQMHDLPRTGTLLFLFTVYVLMVLTPSLAMIRLRARLSEAEEQLHLHAWNLGRFLPGDAARKARRSGPVAPPR